MTTLTAAAYRARRSATWSANVLKAIVKYEANMAHLNTPRSSECKAPMAMHSMR